MTDQAPVRAVLRHRAFRQLAAGRAFTVFGNSLAPVALSFAVLDLTGSLGDLGLVVGVRSLANVAALLFGGVLADRVRRAVILQGSALGSAVVQGVLALSVLLGFASMPLLLVLSMCNGLLAALSLPAAASLTPQTVPAGELRQANALARMGMNVGTIAGSSLGGLLASTAGPGWALAVDAVSFLVGAGCYLAVRVPAADRSGVPQKLRLTAELHDGWREFIARSWVWVVVLQFMVVNAAVSGGIQVIGPGIADATIGRTAWGFALAAQMAGAVVAGGLVARLRVRRALLLGVVAVASEALPLLALAQRPGVALLVSVMFVCGFALEWFAVAWDLSLQENVPADRLARVYSYDALGSFLALPLGEMAAGPLADRFGTRATLLVGALLVLAATAAAAGTRGVRSLVVLAGRPAAPAPRTEDEEVMSLS
ncbi:MFS family permease [Kitasatospora sp. MAA4]|uniref:MFS transporter n=1 Tax=Kitasatospora sp. MAA4 TaxID=3035093 RepID=UPI0024744E95|nr:MFS transporter [Kitasatospora sp. MAA4]MDH6135811.1 MFS family permease [Kitasatospora sp. MAA4]